MLPEREHQSALQRQRRPRRREVQIDGRERVRVLCRRRVHAHVEHRRGPDLRAGVRERGAAEDQTMKAIETHQRRLSAGEVPHRRRDPERVEKRHRSGREQDRLPQPRIPVPVAAA